MMAFRSQGLDPLKTAGASQFSLLADELAHSSPHSSSSSSMVFSLSSHLHHQQQMPPHPPAPSPQISSHHGLHSIHEGFPFGLGGQDYTFHTSNKAKNFSHSLFKTLSILQHRIRQLELALYCLAESADGQVPEALAKQQTVAAGIASAVSQVVVATASLLRQLFGSSVHTMASDLQLINMMSRTTGLEFGMLQQATDTPLSSFSSNFSLNPGESLHMVSHDILGSDLEISDMAEQRHAREQDTGRSSFQTNVDYNISTYLDMDMGTNGHLEVPNSHMVNGVTATQVSAHECEPLEGLKDEEDDGEAENLPPGSFELIEMNDAEILAEHTHFCKICGKGFKRDANLRMHMRGHGDEYKTPAALARPADFCQGPAVTRLRRYSCPYVGCKRNKRHKKFQPLKTLLCVKNHYRRSHCDKIHTCSKCRTKKFSVLADLKTHEKHCGCDKWRCSCGTTFSRKDKLLGHIGLFAGHTPAIPLHETEGMITGFNSVNNLLGVNLENESELLFGSGGET